VYGAAAGLAKTRAEIPVLHPVDRRRQRAY